MKEILIAVIAILAVTHATPDCPEDGYVQPHPYNCHSYIACEDGQQVVKECSNGQLFDFKSMECIAAEKATCKIYANECPPFKLLGKNVVLPHECKCDMYYECIGAKMIERVCSLGNSFDVNQRQCISTENAVCASDGGDDFKQNCPASGTMYVPHESECSLYYECKDGMKTEQKCSNGLSFNAEIGTCTWPPSSDCSKKPRIGIQPLVALPLPEQADALECPSEGYTTLPHECSCTVYYHCENGTKSRGECPNGLIYDYVRKVCDFPEAAVCRNHKAQDTAADLVVECPSIGRKRLPHRFNCRLYYECNNGRSRLRSCLQGHFFNKYLEACDLECHGGGDVPIPDTTPKDDLKCPTNCDDNCITRYPVPNQCDQYYQCVRGNLVIKNCPHDLRFDPERQLCTWPNEVDCKNTTTCKEGTKFPHECQCHKYYECNDIGRHVLQECKEGENFDHELLVCMDKDIANCYSPRPGPPDCIGTCSANSTGSLPNKDCRKYCRCNHGTATEVKCPKNQVYDPDLETCNFPEKVNNLKCDPFPCDDSNSGESLPHECTCDLYYTCKNGEKSREKCPNGKCFDYEKGRCVSCLENPHCYQDHESTDAKKCKETCAAHDSSSAIAHENCNRYCVCKNGKREVHECPEGQYFDIRTGYCQWPENIAHLSERCQPFPCGDDEHGKMPHDCDCTKYYECENGKKYGAACKEGLYFDYVKRTCVGRSNDPHCFKTSNDSTHLDIDDCLGKCTSQDSHVRLAHRNCSKYCVCDSGAPYIVKCPEGLGYDVQMKACVPLEQATCSNPGYAANNHVGSNVLLSSQFFQHVDNLYR